MSNRRHPKHRAFISSLCCCACGAPAPSECAHVRMSHFDGVTVKQTGGMGLKPVDAQCVPLCRHCHQDQHQFGERTFWKTQEMNPLALAQSLWRNSGNLEGCRGIVGRARMGVAI